MQHIGIDLGGRKSQVCIRQANGEILQEFPWPTTGLGGVLRGAPKSRVILETCAEAFHVALQAREAGHEVRVVPATVVRALGVGSRGIKTDVRDARVSSEASCRMRELPSVHIPSAAARRLKLLLSQRDMLVATRTQLINSVRGVLRCQVVRIPGGAPQSFPERVRKSLEDDVPAAIERSLNVIETLNEQLKEADKELKAATNEHPICWQLKSVNGVGPVTSARFVSTVDTPERFSNAHGVESYIGLTPGESSSSGRIRRTGLTKAGQAATRGALIQACWSMWRTAPLDPLSRWARQVADRRGKQVAIAAMARKLAGILYAMWRDGTVYDPSRVSSIEAPSVSSAA